jgi:hypothetical protein
LKSPPVTNFKAGMTNFKELKKSLEKSKRAAVKAAPLKNI